MRLIGERSLTGGVRWLLGLANVFVAIGLVALVPATVFSWLAPDFAADFLDGISRAGDGPAIAPGQSRLLAPLTVTVATVAVALTWLIIHSLRRIFATLTAGDPFQPTNVGWLQTVGAALAGMELTGMILPLVVPNGAREAFEVAGPDIDLTAWLAVLIVFILAEVFREGARMRDDTRMTV